MIHEGSVGRLLTRAFATLVLIVVGAGLIELGTVVLQTAVVRQLTAHVEPLEIANARLRAVLTDAQRGLRGYLLTGDTRLLDTYFLAHSDYALAAQDVRDLATGAERDQVDTQIARADAWFAIADRQREAAPRSDDAGRYVTVGAPVFSEFVTANTALDQDLTLRAATLQRRIGTLQRITAGTVGLLTLAVAALAGLIAVRTGRRITGPLSGLVAVLNRQRAGDHAARADPAAGPIEIRAVAEAMNVRADESDRLRAADEDSARLRGRVRELGYRIRAHLVAADAVDETLRGCAAVLGADHVLVRPAAGLTGVPEAVSLRGEHRDGPLAALAAAPIAWLGAGQVWARGDDEAGPPDAEIAACAAAGDGPVLTVAISAADECAGALTLIRAADRPAFGPAEIRMAEVVAADLGRALHVARLYEREQHLVVRLQELDTAKTDFMSTVSHELRTPLTSISGYVELMLDAEAGDLEPAQRRMLEVIARNTRRLRELIEDMLILSRIESGGFRTTKRTVDLAVLVENAVAAVAPAASKAGVGLHTEVAGALTGEADAEQIDRVLANLLTNAVKFTPPEGTVSVLAERRGDELVLVVADTGLGIPEHEQKELFGRFFRASNAIHLAIPGTGLGLAIVRTIVENHGGSIALRSAENAGTTVTVRLPA